MRKGKGIQFDGGNPAGNPGADGNGHKAGITTPGFMEGSFTQSSFPSALKAFTDPGKEPVHLLMRTYIEDTRKANACVLFMQRCNKFDDKKHMAMLLNWLAIQTSIKGRARGELLQAVVGQLLPLIKNKEIKVKSEPD